MITQSSTIRRLALTATLIACPLARHAVAEDGQWVAKGTQPKPAAAATPGSATPAVAAGQQPLIIYVPQGTPLPSNQPSWVLEGFLKAKEHAAKDAEQSAESPPVEAAKPLNKSTAKSAPAPFQPPSGPPRIASPAPTPTLAPPRDRGKSEEGGLFRWPEGMLSESSDAAAPRSEPQPKRPRALFAPQPAQPELAQPAPAPPIVAPAPQPSSPTAAPPEPDGQGVAAAPRSSLLPTNRPRQRSAMVRPTSPPAAPASPVPADAAPAAVPDNPEPKSIVTAPKTDPSPPGDEKALLPRSVISKFWPGGRSDTTDATADRKSDPTPKKPWSKFLPTDRPAPAQTATRRPASARLAPAAPPISAPPNGEASEATASTSAAAPQRGTAARSRGKALFPRNKAAAPPEPALAAQPAPHKPTMEIAAPVDPFAASNKLMPQSPRRAKASVPSAVLAEPSKPPVVVPREEIVQTAPIPVGQSSLADEQGSKRRARPQDAPHRSRGRIASTSPGIKADASRLAAQKVAPRPWKSLLETAEQQPSAAASAEPVSPGGSIAKSPTSTSAPKIIRARPSTMGTGKPVMEVVTIEPRASAASVVRHPTIIVPEPADRSAAVISDAAPPASQGGEVDSAAKPSSPRPNPVRMRERGETGDSLLTSARMPATEVARNSTQADDSAPRTNPIRITRGSTRAGSNPLR